MPRAPRIDNSTLAFVDPSDLAAFRVANNIAGTTANNSFTGINTYAGIKLYPNFLDLGIGAISTTIDGTKGYIYDDGTGALTIVAAGGTGTTWNLETGLLSAGASGTLDFATQAITGNWTFGNTVTFAQTGNDGPVSKFDSGKSYFARSYVKKATTPADDPTYFAFVQSINEFSAAVSGRTLDDSTHSTSYVMQEFEWYDPSQDHFQNEFNVTLGARVMNFVRRIGSAFASVASAGPTTTTVTTEADHNLPAGTSTIQIIGRTGNSNTGDLTATRTGDRTFTLPFAVATLGTGTGATGGIIRTPTAGYYGSNLVSGIFGVQLESTDVTKQGSGLAPIIQATAYRPVNEFSEISIENLNTGDTAAGNRISMRGIGSAGGGIAGGYSTYWDIATDSGAGGTTNGGTNSITFINRRAASEGAGDAVQRPFHITHAGNVGIGNVAPATKLDVTGTITSTGLVSSTGAVTLSPTTGALTIFPMFGVGAINNCNIGQALAGLGTFAAATGGTYTFTGATASPATYTMPAASATMVSTTTLSSATLPASFTTLAASGTATLSKLLTLGSTQSASAWTTSGIALSEPAASYTDSTSSGTVAVTTINNIAAPTLLASSATTYTDSFVTRLAGPPVASTNVTQTRAHTLGILDSTSAASSITGGLVVATTFGTTATSVGIGGGNINAGGSITGVGFTSTGSNFLCGASSGFFFSSQSRIYSQADGNIHFRNANNNGFTSLSFGTQATPEWKIGTSGTTFAFRATNDTVDASITAANVTASGTLAVTGVSTHTGGSKVGATVVGSLPAAGSNTYLELIVTDSLAPVVGSTVAAGGSAKAKVISNATNWIVTATL